MSPPRRGDPADTGQPSPTVPPLGPGDPPLAVLVDYDGTIALADVTDTLLARHVPGEWEALDELYLEGRIGSRELMSRQIALLHVDEPALRATAAALPYDPAFVPFVERARDAGVPVEVVSDGFGFYVRPALDALGLTDLPVATSRAILDARPPRMEFPFGHPDCFVCGTCKRSRVLAHRAAGRAVVFVGDGESDRYAAAHADLVFAKARLAAVCAANGWSYRPWSSFAEIDRWLGAALDDWRAGGSALPRREPRPFVCGPEAWGPGRTRPPA